MSLYDFVLQLTLVILQMIFFAYIFDMMLESTRFGLKIRNVFIEEGGRTTTAYCILWLSTFLAIISGYAFSGTIALTLTVIAMGFMGGLVNQKVKLSRKAGKAQCASA